MINQTQNGNNGSPATDSVKTHENQDQKKTATKASIVPESKILESNLAIASTDTPTNEKLRPDLMQRTIAPVNTDLTDLIMKKVEGEIANSPECTVYSIWVEEGDNIQARFSKVVKEDLYKAGFSEEEVNDAFVASNGIENNIPCCYVSNPKINHHLKELSDKLKLHPSDLFEIFDTKLERWGSEYCAGSDDFIKEIMLNPRYINITDIYDDNYCYIATLTTNKEKFISDRIAQYLSSATNIFIKELYSNKSPEEKIKNLQAIVSPDYLLSNDNSQEEEIPCISAESLLDRLDFAPNGIKYNLLVQSDPRYREDTL